MEAKELVSPKQISTEQVEAFVQDKYGLEKTGVSTAISQGVESAVWLIPTNDGKWYAKVYGQHEGPLSRIQEETRLYEYLSADGIRVPDVRATKDGQKAVLIETEHGQYSTILMKYEELKKKREDQRAGQLSEAAKLGAALERFARPPR